MTTITQSITPLPVAPDPFTMDRDAFNVAAAAFVLAQKAEAVELETFRTQVNTVKGEMVTHAADTAADAIATAADRVQTGLDVISAAASAASAAAIAGAFVGTSTTSLSIGSGSKTFTTQTGEQYTSGIWMTAVSQANPANFMFGQVTSYSSTTLILDVQLVGGSGTHADWNLSLAGPRGADGTLSGSVSGNISGGDYTLSAMMQKDMGYVVVDKGNISGATVTFDYTGGSIQTFTATGSTVTLATSNWPPTGNLGELLIVGTNMGAYTMSFPSWIWTLADGTTTTSVATFLAQNGTRTAFQASGVDKILLITRDAGTTVYASLVAI